VNKKILQKIFKTIFYSLFSIIYGKIKDIIEISDDNRIKVKNFILDNKLKYNVYEIAECRLYTDRIHDTAAILDNKIINGPSFQQRYTQGSNFKIYNAEVKNNIVLKIGTPRILRKLNGVVLSLLTGGAGNNNYWHWLHDVLPRIGLCSKSFNLNEINYYLVPSLLKKFQNETLDVLNIPKNKRLSSSEYRHIITEKLIITDHPVVVSGNSTLDIQNIPNWIILWLKENFIKKNIIKNKKASNKIYIERDLVSKNKISARSISNDSEVKKYLLNKGFYVVRLGELDFQDQVNLFYNAEHIIGLHGAAFANIVFCKPKTRIIEIKSLSAGSAIGNLAKKNNLNYKSVDVDDKHIHKHDSSTKQRQDVGFTANIEIPLDSLNEIFKNK